MRKVFSVGFHFIAADLEYLFLRGKYGQKSVIFHVEL